MFYSQELLSKKGALGTIWAAAHSLKKLTKEDVFDSNISSFVGNKQHPLHSFLCMFMFVFCPLFVFLVLVISFVFGNE